MINLQHQINCLSFFSHQMNKLILLVALVTCVTAATANWVNQLGPRVQGLTCSKVLEDEEDFVDLVQAAAKVLGGRKSGPVLE